MKETRLLDTLTV